MKSKHCLMERRVRGNSHARCGTGEKLEITSKVYLSSLRAPEYRLTHLLANGHALRQGGRATGDPFLANACRIHSAKFEARVKGAIRDAGR